jgi:benzoate transport
MAIAIASAAAPAASADERWSPLQLIVVGLCFVVNMIDGMDVLILSYIAPTLQEEWGVAADRLGILFSAGILGMAIGGIVLAPLADLFGRRLVIIASLIVSTIGMILSGFAADIPQLMVLRLLVGVGIGTVLASMAAIIAEYAPDRHRNFAVGLLYAGYPLGAIITGFVAVQAIPAYGWHAVLTGAGLVSALMVPTLIVLLPESMQFLIKRRPPRALERLNRILARMGRPQLSELPLPDEAPTKAGVAGLFADGRTVGTLLLWAAMILGFAALWFIISWIPKLAILSGLDQANGIYAGTIFNVGAFLGTVVLGLITARFKLQRVVMIFLFAAAGAMILFGSVAMPVPLVLAVAFLIGFLLQGGFNGIYPLAARLYPAEVRSTGIGWTMGVGRLGAVMGPFVGGILIARETPLPLLFAIFAAPAVIAGCCALAVNTEPKKPSGKP